MEKAVIVLATRNKGKLKEFNELARELPLEFISLHEYPEAPEVQENGDSFLANAAKKAVELARFTGKITLADDSGLEVDALGGAPGIYSARFSGENANDHKNNEKLLKLMENVQWEDRTARFKCVLVLAYPDGKYQYTEGTCEGYINTILRGENGFGYDPLFYLQSYEKSFAEIPSKLKNEISHRAKAWDAMRKIIVDKGIGQL